MIASATTFVKAVVRLAPANSREQTNGFVGLVSPAISKKKNYKRPMIMSQLFLLVPQSGTLSEIKP